MECLDWIGPGTAEPLNQTGKDDQCDQHSDEQQGKRLDKWQRKFSRGESGTPQQDKH
jgi:hypothetical protein